VPPKPDSWMNERFDTGLPFGNAIVPLEQFRSVSSPPRRPS